MADDTYIALTADIVSAHVASNKVAISDLPLLIENVFAALKGTVSPIEPETVKQESAVSVRTSVRPDYLVCLEDGKRVTMLKRYLRTNYDMTPEEYRAKWNLPRDYPMVSPNYAEKRRALALTIGLGRKKAVAPVMAEPVKRAPRKAAKATETPAVAEIPTRKPSAKLKIATPA